MSVWTEEEVARLKERYVGAEEDFIKLLDHLRIVWTISDLETLEREGFLVAWDDYFQREKRVSSDNSSQK